MTKYKSRTFPIFQTKVLNKWPIYSSYFITRWQTTFHRKTSRPLPNLHQTVRNRKGRSGCSGLLLLQVRRRLRPLLRLKRRAQDSRRRNRRQKRKTDFDRKLHKARSGSFESDGRVSTQHDGVHESRWRNFEQVEKERIVGEQLGKRHHRLDGHRQWVGERHHRVHEQWRNQVTLKRFTISKFQNWYWY